MFFRIQPKGLDLKGHYSVMSGLDEYGNVPISDGLHVFKDPSQTFDTAEGFAEWAWEAYGDEIVVIEAEEYWDNEDLEGVNIDPENAVIIARFSLPEWVELWKKVISKDLPEVMEEVKKGYDFQSCHYNLYDWDEDIFAELERRIK